MKRNPFSILLLLPFGPALFGQQYTISTVAGEGGGFLKYPTSVAVDHAGNLYVADWSGAIRKFWKNNRAITVVAGTGVLGYGGDGGLATIAKIGKAVNLVLDDAGNLYIADGDNNRIRRVDASTGIITTVAGTGAAIDSGDGGPAIHAGVARPTGISVDTVGNLYFSSAWSRVRKLDIRTGIIQTIAGQFITSFGGDGGPAMQALFWDPVPSAIDKTGRVYIADFENSRIRMLDPKALVVTTFAGSGACLPAPGPFNTTVCQSGFSGDGGPANQATLNYPQSAALDSAGNLYIADSVNHRIRKVDAATGVIQTIAGTGVNGLSGDNGPASAAQISFPASITVDSSGKVYFADENNNLVRVLTPIVSPLDRLLFRRDRTPER